MKISISLFAVLALTALTTTSHAATVILGTGGATGNLSTYQLGPTTTWDQARVNAASAGGALLSINSAAEIDLVTNFVGTGWTGLTDSTSTSSIDGRDLSLLGTSEGGNTSGLPTPVATSPVAGQRGVGYKYESGDAFNYSRWNGGEPNDSGGEDAIELVGGGVFNDLPAGVSVGQGSNTRAAIIETDLGTSNISQVVTNGFVVTVVKAVDGSMGGGGNGALANVDSLIASQSVPGTVLGSASFALADFNQDSGGDFGTNNSFPGLAQGGNFTDNAAVHATGTLSVGAAGTYFFRVKGDDGGRLRIDGMDIVVDDGFHGFGGPTSGGMALSAGAHTFEWVNFEGGGGWGAELSYGTASGGPFYLVGDGTAGITLAGGTFSATTLKMSGNVDIGNLAAAKALLNGTTLQSYAGTSVQGIASVVNALDGGGDGHFGGNDNFLTITGDDYVANYSGWVYLDATAWTFGTNSDDGTELNIYDANGALVFTKTDDVLAPAHDDFGTFTPAAGGWYNLDLLFFERSGGSEVELFASKGTFTGFGDAGADFQLVGDTALGGLNVFTNIAPEPSTAVLAVLGLMSLGMVRRRERS